MGWEDILKKLNDSDDFLDIGSIRAERYKLSNDSLSIRKVYELLKGASSLRRTAKKLTECILYNKLIEDHQKDSIFKDCSFALKKYVIDVEANQLNSDFLTLDDDNLPCDVCNFRKVLLQELKKEIVRYSKIKNNEKSTKITRFNPNSDINVLSQIDNAKIKLNLYKQFGRRMNADMLPNDLINDDDIENFLNDLVFAVNQPNEVELGHIIQQEIGKEFSFMKSEDVYNCFFVEMLNWMKEREGIYLSHERGKILFDKAKRGLSIWFDVREPVESFTGRKRELESLHSLLQNSPDAMVFPCIVGLGGVGKSELVRKYIQKYSHFYDNNIIWVNAENHQSIEESFSRLAKDKLRIETKDSNGKLKDIQSIVEDVYRYFVRCKCLFVFDNATKYIAKEKEGIDKFLPKGPVDSIKPSIIVTSRNQEWRNKIFKIIFLDVFTEEEAIELISDALKTDNCKDVENLASALQYFPLALQQAIAFIKQSEEELKCVNPGNTFSIADYLKEYEIRTKEVLDFPFPEDSSDSNTKTTFTIWNITVNKVKENEYGSQAMEILHIIAYFAPNNIPVELFLPLAANDERRLGHIIGLLKKYSMIGLEKGLVNIHRLVQKIIKMNLNQHDDKKAAIKKSVVLFKKAFPVCSDKPEDCLKKRILMPHFENILFVIDESNDKNENLVENDDIEFLLECIGEIYGYLGFTRKEKNIFERLLNLVTINHGEDSLQAAHALMCLGTTWGDLGDFLKQKDMMEMALAIMDDRFLENPSQIPRISSIINCLVKLGSAYRNVGDLNSSLQSLNNALNLAEKFYGCKHYEYAIVLQNLAITYGTLGKHDDEKQLLQQAFPVIEEHYGAHHYITGGILGMLGAAYSDLGDQNKAIGFLQRSLSVFKNCYDLNHFQVGQTLGDLGLAFYKLGDYEKAKRYFERHLEIFETHYGENKIQLVAPLQNLSATFGHLGDRDRQICTLERAIEIKRINQLDTTLLNLQLIFIRLNIPFQEEIKNFDQKNVNIQ